MSFRRWQGSGACYACFQMTPQLVCNSMHRQIGGTKFKQTQKLGSVAVHPGSGDAVDPANSTLFTENRRAADLISS